LVIQRSHHRHRRDHKETVALPRWEKQDLTGLEELTGWVSRIILLGGLAVIIGLLVLAVWAFGGTPT
jgi:hypothetical protein